MARPRNIERVSADDVVAEAKAELWRLGNLTWKLHAGQLQLYFAILAAAASRFVLELARRYGKTYLLVLVAIETALKNPGCRVVYGAPTLKHLEEFVHPAFEAICADAPEDCKPTFNAKTSHYVLPNGSHIHLFGADDKRKADRGRGPGAILALFDECGFTPILRYVLRSVLRPQLLHTKRRQGTFNGMMLLGSTPAEEPDHDFTVIAERAEAKGNYARRTIYDNPLLTKEQVDQFLKDDAEEEGMSIEQYLLTDDFRREWLAERVTNKLLIVMGQDWEWSREKSHNLYVEIQKEGRPEYFDACTTLDFGGHDPHAALFDYWHFTRACLVVEDELLLRNGENTEELANALKAKERALWQTTFWEGTLRAYRDEKLVEALPDWFKVELDKNAPQQPYVRWCDNDIQLARDLYELHGYAVVPTSKDDLELQVNNARVLVRQTKVAINPACKDTDRHLKSTVWANHKRKEWKRKNGEHGDLLACLIYRVRNIDRQRNPYPEHHRVTLITERQARIDAKAAGGDDVARAFFADNPLARKLIRPGR